MKAGKKERGTKRAFGLALVFFLVFICFNGRGITQSLTELSNQIKSGTTEEKRDALLALRSLRSEEASRLALVALLDRNPMVRAMATSSVGFLPRAEAVAALSPLLKDKDEFVRSEAAYALGKTGDPSPAASLIKALGGDRSGQVRSAVAVALGQIGSPAAISPLKSILDLQPREDAEMLRRAAARSLGQIAQILRSGNAVVLTPQNFLPEKFKDVSAKPSADLLAQFRESVQTLVRVLDNPNEAADTRREAAFALGAIGDTSAEASLKKYAASEDIYLGEIVKEALLKLAS